MSRAFPGRGCMDLAPHPPLEADRLPIDSSHRDGLQANTFPPVDTSGSLPSTSAVHDLCNSNTNRDLNEQQRSQGRFPSPTRRILESRYRESPKLDKHRRETIRVEAGLQNEDQVNNWFKKQRKRERDAQGGATHGTDPTVLASNASNQNFDEILADWEALRQIESMSQYPLTDPSLLSSLMPMTYELDTGSIIDYTSSNADMSASMYDNVRFGQDPVSDFNPAAFPDGTLQRNGTGEMYQGFDCGSGHG
ncbi:hypothetical protein EV356DRAFT_172717 [Viridothelium virens]|uniref:Homeobox domain-containing protein n=1 Tax=Viridothelium virens TaxID=1048519 RepID=A0A6A6H831_VIRVR|nr:hypothetical protein EV356DRAFT_172717 [Viridothelium virens]